MTKCTELCSDGTQAHHWVIGSDYIGHCIKPNCNAVKGFAPKEKDKPARLYLYSEPDNIPTMFLPEGETEESYSHPLSDGRYYKKLLGMLEDCPRTSGTECGKCPHQTKCLKWWEHVTTYTTGYVIREKKYQEFRLAFLKLKRSGKKPVRKEIDL